MQQKERCDEFISGFVLFNGFVGDKTNREKLK